MIGAFARTIRDLFLLADRGCSGWAEEARSNCEAMARGYAITNSAIFAGFAALLILMLLLLP
jgi:hypothetical protein